MPSLLCRKRGLATRVISHHVEVGNNILLLQETLLSLLTW